MKSTIRFLIWLMTLNLLMNFIFPKPVELEMDILRRHLL